MIISESHQRLPHIFYEVTLTKRNASTLIHIHTQPAEEVNNEVIIINIRALANFR